MTSYDEVPYPTYAFSQTHPGRLATIARLNGMTPADPRRCRVLELGCGAGGNLIPMAAELPESEFLGVDLAARPVAEGRELIEEVGLKNVTLRREDITEFPADAGLFDYVIAHGVYSWIPAEVRERLLAVAGAHLAPQGVAFVSYNAYPGGHLRDMLREMMLFHVREIEDPYRRTDQARALLKFLADSQTDDDHYARLLRAELARVVEFPPEHLFHDDLSEINEHFYFTQFVEHAARHRLQYLGDAYYHRSHTRWRPPGAHDPLAGLDGNPLLKEQYGDFLNCRRFRHTLLCRDEVVPEREQRPEQMREFHFAARVNPAPPDDDASKEQRTDRQDDPPADSQADPNAGPHVERRGDSRADPRGSSPADPRADARTEEPRRFIGMNDVRIEIGLPLAKAALARLGELWPRAVAFDDLLDDARSILGRRGGDGREEDAGALCRFLLTTYAGGFLEAHAHPSSFVAGVSERPRTTALARAQALRGATVTNLRHVNLSVEDAMGRRLIQLLDGTRDRAALLSELKVFVESGGAPGREGEPAADPREVLELLPERLEANLERLASYALFVS